MNATRIVLTAGAILFILSIIFGVWTKENNSISNSEIEKSYYKARPYK